MAFGSDKNKKAVELAQKAITKYEKAKVKYDKKVLELQNCKDISKKKKLDYEEKILKKEMQ